jgi:hypothetical protein
MYFLQNWEFNSALSKLQNFKFKFQIYGGGADQGGMDLRHWDSPQRQGARLFYGWIPDAGGGVPGCLGNR